MRNSLTDRFSAIWVLDTEFRARPGDQNEPVCLCARELVTGRRVELFFDQPVENPFTYTEALFVGFEAAAEWKTLLALGWALPRNIVDLRYEYLLYANGVWRGNQNLRRVGTGLVDAMQEFNLDGISHDEKDTERDYILAHQCYPPEGKRRILDYCWLDVDGTELLLEAMLPFIDLDQALLRGSYSRAVAWTEHNGLPISPQYAQIESHAGDLQVVLAREVEEVHGYGVYDIIGKKHPRPVFRQRGFDELVRRLGLWDSWPKTPRQHCCTADDKAFRAMARLHPELQALRETRKVIRSLSLLSSAIGADGRNRCSVFPFGTLTGRNNPKAREFILSRPHSVRNLIAPTKDRAIVGADIVAAETAIAADSSGDPELLRIYNGGLDQYLEFAKASGVVPKTAVRNERDPRLEAIRDRYKIASLAIQYGIGPQKLATNLGIPFWEADRIIGSHKRKYATYWCWAQAQVEKAYQDGFICTTFGWRMAVDPQTSFTTLLNFPQQAVCAELLRLTCILVEERGMGPMLCAPHHDALYLECRDDEAQDVSQELQECFLDAAGEVLSGRVKLRLEPRIIKYPDHYEDKKGAEIWKRIQGALKTLKDTTSAVAVI